MDIRLDHKSVFVTGGTGSIGMALIEVFSNSGSNVFFQYNKNENQARELQNKYNAEAVKMDFEGDDLLPNTNFDIVVNNAGINITKSMALQVSSSDWKKTMKINLDTPYRVIIKYLPSMIKNKWGRIINISSIYGVRGSTNNLPYNTSKHGLSGLTKSIAKEYANSGITCNEICPGAVESKLMDLIAENKERDTGILKDEYLRSVMNTIPDKRFARPKEIAWLALFLASEFASHINGTSIIIDGGAIA